MRSWHWPAVSLFPESLLRFCELALMPLNGRGAWHHVIVWRKNDDSGDGGLNPRNIISIDLS